MLDNAMFNNLIFNVLLSVIVVLIGAVTRNLLPYLRRKKEEALTQIRQTQWAWAADIIDAVVRAVEQTISDEIHGEGKKEMAISYIKILLRQNDITLSDEQIDALIEAAVQAMNAEVAAA